MGKVVKVIAVVVAIAVVMYAPQISATILAAISIKSAVAVALFAAALTVGVGLSLKTLGVGAPSVKGATKPPYPQGTAMVGGFGRSPPQMPLERRMEPLRCHWLRHLDVWGLGRFSIIELQGDCMAPKVTDRFAIVDLKAVIREGDLFAFDVRDRRTAFAQYRGIRAIVKRFRGVNRDAGFLECECTKPAAIIHTGLTMLRFAHRVRATAPTLIGAWRLLWAVRRDPAAFDARLMA